jgi:hypothetical protein
MSDNGFISGIVNQFVEGVTELQTFKRVYFDLETVKGEESEFQAEFAREFNGKGIEILAIEDEKKREKEMEKFEERKAEWIQRAALKNSAQIVCAVYAVETEDGTLSLPLKAFTWMPLSPEGVQKLAGAGIDCVASPDEKAMLAVANMWLDTMPISLLSGQNIFGFDLRKWRHRCGRWQVKRADVFSPHTETRLFDTQYEFGKYFAMNSDMYAKLPEIAGSFGIEHMKLGDGSRVGELYVQKQYETIIAYCAGDVLLTREVALRMLD